MTFLKNGDDDEERQTFLPPSHAREIIPTPAKQSPRNAIWYLRILLELTMAATIVILLIHLFPDSNMRASPVPRFPRKTYTFTENHKYLNEDMFATREETLHTLHNWIELSADGRGYVQINDPSFYGLGEPYDVRVNLTNNGPAYMMSVFHQLHCLSYIVEHYQTGFAGVELTKEVAHHSAHCFDYLRQSIMCAADTSLEGNTEAGPGWGSDHECVDYSALLAWANQNGVERWRGNMPEESVL